MANTAGGPLSGGVKKTRNVPQHRRHAGWEVAKPLLVNIPTDKISPQRTSAFPTKAGWHSNGFAAQS